MSRFRFCVALQCISRGTIPAQVQNSCSNVETLEILTPQCSSRRNRAFRVSAVQPRSLVRFRRCHSEQVAAVAVAACPVSITHLCSLLFPWCFPAAAPPSTGDSHTPVPPALAHGCVHWPDFSDLALAGQAPPDLSLQGTAPWGSKAYWDSLLLLSNFQPVPKQKGVLFIESFLGTTSSKEWDKQENNSKGNVQPNHYRSTHHRLSRSICLTAHCNSSAEVTHM